MSSYSDSWNRFAADPLLQFFSIYTPDGQLVLFSAQKCARPDPGRWPSFSPSWPVFHDRVHERQWRTWINPRFLHLFRAAA